MRIAFDTNVVAYAEGFGDPERNAKARDLLADLSHHRFVLPIQVGIELANLVVRKFRRTAADSSVIVARWHRLCPDRPGSDGSILEAALGLTVRHRLQIFDAIILAASAEAGARLLLSEDMQDGFVWRGVTVANPFADTLHPMIVDLMRDRRHDA